MKSSSFAEDEYNSSDIPERNITGKGECSSQKVSVKVHVFAKDG